MKNINKKNNGITLIALVITIIVLLLLAGISISMLSGQDGILTKATRAKEETSDSEQYDKVALAVQEALVNGMGKIDLTEGSNEKNSLEKALEKAFENDSKKPTYEEGKITLSNGEKYNVTTSGSIEKQKVITFSKTGNLVIGTEVTASNGEKFYVIGGDNVGEIEEGAQNILLLAKYNLKKENDKITLKQDTTTATNPCAFSSTNYWSSVPGIAYPYTSGENNGKYPDLNDKATYPLNGATSIITIAEEYGETLGATGRLMTYEEAKIFKDVNSTILYGKYESGKFINYWLGSANLLNSMWFVFGGNSVLNGVFYVDDGFGVRPVIKISKSLIK